MGVFLVFLIVVGLCVGGYGLYWWLAKDTTDRQGQINQHQFSRQVGLVDGINDHANDVTAIDVQIAGAPDAQKSALQAQRKAIVQTICTDGAQLNDTAQMTPAARQIYATC